MNGFFRAVLIFLILVPPAWAAELSSLESLAAPLLLAKSYCESGRWGTRIGTDPTIGETRYRLCASAGGRFKYIEFPGEPQQLEIWSDGQRLHRFVEYGRSYHRYDLSQREAGYTYERPDEKRPVMHSRLFRWVTRGPEGLDLLGSLRDYRPTPEISDAQHIVHERRNMDTRRIERISVSAADGTFLRYESWYDGVMRSYAEVTSREVDRPIAEADLTHEVPLYARYSSQNNPPVFIAALFVLATIVGLAFWTWRFARAKDPGEIARIRSQLWRIFRWSLGIAAALLGMLGAATWGGSGHPPAIAYVWALAVLTAIGFGLAMCFLLTSYAAQAFARARH